MERRCVIGLLILSFLLAFPVLQAQEETQEQEQTYSGLERFVDNVKMFFSSGDGKVMLALEVREKEVNSAVNSFQKGNEEEAVNGLERARERLQLIQEKVSPNAAEAVNENIERFTLRLNELENFSEEIGTYKLEEEKTKLIAKLVIEVNGSQGQTLKREIVKNETSGDKKIIVIVEGGSDGQMKTRVIEGQIGEINNQIAERVIAERVIKTDIAGGNSGGEGLSPEVKTSVAEGGNERNDPLPEPDLNKINPDLYDPNARAPGDQIGGEGENSYAEGTTAEGGNNLAP